MFGLKKRINELEENQKKLRKEMRILRFVMDGKKFRYYVYNGYAHKNLHIESVDENETEIINIDVTIPDNHEIIENDDYLEIWQVLCDHSRILYGVYTVNEDEIVSVDIKLYSAYLEKQNKRSA